MTKKERELELEALLKSSQDRVRASNNIQTSFNAFNDFINVADKRLNSQMDTIDTKMNQFENTLNNIQTTQKKAIRSLHKETIQASLNEEFRKKINNQYKELSTFLNKFDEKLHENSETIEKQYNDLYRNNVSVIALKSFHGLFYVFYLLVCIGSLVCFSTIENILAHKTLEVTTIIGQLITASIIGLIPYWSWKFFLAEENIHYSQINKVLTKASIIGFSIGFIAYFSYAYFYMRL